MCALAGVGHRGTRGRASFEGSVGSGTVGVRVEHCARGVPSLLGGRGDAGGDARNTERALLAGVCASETASRKEEKSQEGEEKHMFFSFLGTGAAAAASAPAARTAYSDKSLQSSSPAGGKTHLRRCDTGMGTRPSRTFARCEQACGV